MLLAVSLTGRRKLAAGALGRTLTSPSQDEIPVSRNPDALSTGAIVVAIHLIVNDFRGIGLGALMLEKELQP